MRKFTGILAIVILLVLSYEEYSPYNHIIDGYTGEFQTNQNLKNEIYEKDITCYDDSLVFNVPE